MAVVSRDGEAVAPSGGDGFDPLSERIRRCPHPHYADLVSRSVTPLPAYPNFYAVAGYDEVVEVLMKPDVYDGQPFPDADVPIMSAMRPERHSRVRRAVQSLFTKRALDQLSPFILEVVARRTDRLLHEGRGDLMSLWANPIPLSVIARMFGFPDGDADLARLHRYGDAAIRLAIPLGGPGLPLPRGWRVRLRQLEGIVRALPSVVRLSLLMASTRRGNTRESRVKLPNPMVEVPGYPRTGLPHHPELARLAIDFQVEVLRIFKQHLDEPGNDVVDLLIEPYLREELSLREVLGAAQQILVAGYETTANTLGSAVHRMAENPDILPALRANPERIEPFVEELLRLDAPLQRTLRRTTRPVTLGGVDLPENAQLIIMLGAANVDPARFDDPHRFDPERASRSRHLAFGRGIHVCLGAQLARLESRIALTEFVRRVDAVLLDPDRTTERVVDKDIGMWGFTRLPVVVRPRTQVASVVAPDAAARDQRRSDG